MPTGKPSLAITDRAAQHTIPVKPLFNRLLGVKEGSGRRHPRTPAMAAGLTDHVWTLAEWVTLPAVH